MIIAPSDRLAARSRDAEAEARVSIVYVEDNIVNAVLFESMVELHAAWSIRTVPDGASALALVAHHTPDLLVIDGHLPDIDGAALLQSMRALHPVLASVPAVMFTADSSHEQVLESRAAGFIDHWVKPMDVALLMAAMRPLVAYRSAACAAVSGRR